MHEGHRERIRNRFLKNGEEAFEEHELLETLLFYAIPRCNTNEIAHELIHTFGSLRGVLDADYEQLQSVKGIGANAAFLLHFIPAILRAYIKETHCNVVCFDKMSVAREYGAAMLFGRTKETVCLLTLDHQLRQIDDAYLWEGSVNDIRMNLSEFYRYCLGRRAAAVILYHNHPRGLAVPSREDMEMTYLLEGKLKDVGICLLEHFVVSERACMPILHAQSALSGRAPVSSKIDVRRLEDFYCN